jgi:transcriptional regulator with XRE-family HTH domain
MSNKNIHITDEKLSRLLLALSNSGLKKYGLNRHVCEKTGYSQPRVSELLSGKHPLPKKFITIICGKYNISEEWLETGEGEMFIWEDSRAIYELSQGKEPHLPAKTETSNHINDRNENYTGDLQEGSIKGNTNFGASLEDQLAYQEWKSLSPDQKLLAVQMLRKMKADH